MKRRLLFSGLLGLPVAALSSPAIATRRNTSTTEERLAALDWINAEAGAMFKGEVYYPGIARAVSPFGDLYQLFYHIADDGPEAPRAAAEAMRSWMWSSLAGNDAWPSESALVWRVRPHIEIVGADFVNNKPGGRLKIRARAHSIIGQSVKRESPHEGVVGGYTHLGPRYRVSYVDPRLGRSPGYYDGRAASPRWEWQRVDGSDSGWIFDPYKCWAYASRELMKLNVRTT